MVQDSFEAERDELLGRNNKTFSHCLYIVGSQHFQNVDHLHRCFW